MQWQVTWQRVAAPLGGSAQAVAAVGRELAARYGQPHRAYHTLEHVEAVLATVADLVAAGEPVADRTAVDLAACLHDAVYDPRAGDNEAASAALAAAVLPSLGADDALVTRVGELVMATRDHLAADGDAAVLVDADLAVLGAEPARYRAYVAAVRREYHWLAAAQWARGRAALLRGLLGRPRLYATPTMRARAEARARANLTAELATLSPTGCRTGQILPEMHPPPEERG